MCKILALLSAVLLAVQNISAQHNMYVVSKSGKLKAYSAQKVMFHDDLFTFTYDETSNISMKGFTVSFKVEAKDATVKSLFMSGYFETTEVGVCVSSHNCSPTVYDGKVKLGEYMKSYTKDIRDLEKGTTYYYRAYVRFGWTVAYGDVRQVTTYGDKSETDDCKIINGHKFIDLGLPSGLLWAETNIGALSASDDGEYFAWGETTSKYEYSWDTYKYGSSQDDITKYNSTDGKTVLEKEDDAACVIWGDGCRMPTRAEFDELTNSDNCTWTWIDNTIYDSDLQTRGYEVKSNRNGNSIFLPVLLYTDVAYGKYWSSTVGDVRDAYHLYFMSGNDYRVFRYLERYLGKAVRPVAEP